MDELKEDEMMPLTMANVGETNVIKKDRRKGRDTPVS